jgi:hypothetical protein
VVPGDLQTQILKKNCLIKTKEQKKEDYNIVLGQCFEIIKVKDVLPSPFYSGTYHPPVFAAHSPLYFVD